MGERSPVGKIEYGYGDSQIFYETEKYVQGVKEALSELGITGVKMITLTKDPATHKAIDNLICDFADIENPYDLAHYQKKYDPAATEDRTQQAEAPEPEPEDEELEL